VKDHKNHILAYGRALGLDQLCISPIDLPYLYYNAFDNWIKNGYHANMSYLNDRVDEKECHKKDIIHSRMPKAQSMITAAVNYYRQDSETLSPNSNSGIISRYAVSRDYHKVISKKLIKLCRFIENELKGNARFYVDTGPIMEKAYGETSGLGFIGKNSMLINGDFGSWIFLGVIITSLDLEPDVHHLPFRCGSCQRCINACPTKAIVKEKTVNSNLCLSYQTIENRGTIPVELRKSLGNLIFGCDICQEVCPHNCREKPCVEKDFKNRLVDRHISLIEILAIDSDQAFTERFKGTPIMRAKRRGLQRNACIAAGNSGDKLLIHVLKEFIGKTRDHILIEHAQWALAQLNI
jgi:epoxyqueuosine reductase